MATFLFDKTIFGPVMSRRLGVSLGINLLPNNMKLCSFDCIYCECGWNPDYKSTKAVLPSRKMVSTSLVEKLIAMKTEGNLPDVITFAGNGEPTMHPEFAEIIDDTIEIRNTLAPEARIAVLSNATMVFKEKVRAALMKVDDNIQKLDSGVPETVKIMNQPVGQFDLEKVVDQLKYFKGKLIIQTMFLKGTFQGQNFDNTSDKEVQTWIHLLEKIQPRKVMIYTIARDTPLQTLEKISKETLEKIASIVQKEIQLPVEVSA